MGFNISLVLLVFENVSAENAAKILNSSVMLSRSASIITLLLWTGFLFLRFKTHTALFEEDAAFSDESDYEGPPYVKVRSTNWDILGPIPRLIVFVLYLAILMFFVDSFVVALIRFPPRFQAMICTFAVPLLIRPMSYVDILRYARLQWINSAIETSLRIGLCTAMLVAPTLVMIGWMLSRPVTLVFSTTQTAAYAVAVWFVIIFVNGPANYLKGCLLICIYILMAFALGVLNE